jgi:hypothetical protein
MFIQFDMDSWEEMLWDGILSTKMVSHSEQAAERIDLDFVPLFWGVECSIISVFQLVELRGFLELSHRIRS